MNRLVKPIVGSGITQWPRSGWWSVLGVAGNAGLLAGACLMIRDGSWIGWLWLSVFMLAAIVPPFLWMRRTVVDPYVGIQIVFASSAVAWTFAMTTAVFIRPDLLIQYSAKPSGAKQEWLLDMLTRNPSLALIALLVFPVFGFWYHRFEMRSRRNRMASSEA